MRRIVRLFVRLIQIAHSQAHLDVSSPAHDGTTDDAEYRHGHCLDGRKVGEISWGPILRDIDEVVQIFDMQNKGQQRNWSR